MGAMLLMLSFLGPGLISWERRGGGGGGTIPLQIPKFMHLVDLGYPL